MWPLVKRSGKTNISHYISARHTHTRLLAVSQVVNKQSLMEHVPEGKKETLREREKGEMNDSNSEAEE